MERTRWYKDAVFYQIYPRSFCDSNGDGIGDIRGIISKLDYLKDLGVNAVWLSPVYESPNDDNGYDISDYRKIQKDFGTLEDWKEMIKGMHDRGIKLVMDLVVNHTSDEHEWFKQSRSSKDNPYRDYYIWRKGRGKNGKKPPNNWSSRFTGTAWEYDETTQEWYLHLFGKKQPDLNWDNPKVRQEVIDICNYWFDLGVDGFRCDVITYISKKEGLPNGKFNPIMCGDEHFIIGEHWHEYIKQVHRESWGKYDTMIVGEAIGCKVSQAESVIDEKVEELDSAITFELMEVDMWMNFLPLKLNLRKFKEVQNNWQSLPETCWNTLYYENHDQPRSVSRYCPKGTQHRKEMAKTLAISLHMLRGTPYVYQGQEIGMTNIELKEEEYIDLMARQVFTLIKKIFPPLMPVARWAMSRRARDHARTPMQWNDGVGAGFSVKINEDGTTENVEATPWMKLNPNYKEINVQESLADEDSILNFYKKLIAFRKGNDIIKNGSFKMVYPNDNNLFVYEREYQGEKYVVICNFRDKTVKKNMSEVAYDNAELVLSSYKDGCPKLEQKMVFRPFEGLVYKVTK